MRWWQRQSLRFKFALGINLTMLLVLGGSFYGIAQYVRAQLWQREVQAAENLNAVAATLLEDAMMVGRKDRIQEALDQLGDSVGGQIDSLAVYDDQAVLTAFSSGFPGGRVIQRESLAVGIDEPTCRECHQLPAEERPSMTVISLEGQDVIRNVVPLYNEPRCQTCHGVGQAVLGDSIVDLRLDRYNQSLRSVLLGLGGGIALSLVLVALVLYFIVRRTVLGPMGNLLQVTEAVTSGDLTREVIVRSGDEMGQVGVAFNAMTTQLRGLVGELEQRVEERTRDLERHSQYLEAVADVGAEVASIVDPDVLVDRVVELVRERFDLYYVGLFVVDEAGEWAVLRAGSGDAGKRMVAGGHRIKVGEGMIGWSIAQGRDRVAMDAGADAVRLVNPDLPETRSELALPLRSRGRVLGALTVQSREREAFGADTVAALRTMADQVAVAFENAAMFMQTQRALVSERQVYGDRSREAWLQMGRDQAAYSADATGVRVAGNAWSPEMVAAGQSGQVVHGGDEATIAMPVVVRGEVAGVVRLRKPSNEGKWTEAEISLMETVIERLGVTLDGARLYRETQITAARERTIAEATTEMREPLELEDVLQTAVREIRSVLDLDELVLKMVPSEEQAD